MIDKSKQYRTRDGRQVEIVCTDLSGSWPVLAIVTNEDGGRYSRTYTYDGRSSVSLHNAPGDLVEVKPRIKRTYWVNVYDHCLVNGGHTKERADRERDRYSKRLACVPVTIDCEEGEGLVEGK